MSLDGNTKLSAQFIAGVVFLTLASVAHAQHVQPANAVENQDGSIIEVAAEANSFVKLLTAVEAAGLTEILRGQGPFTIFAPTDSAFGKLDQGFLNAAFRPENAAQLQSILEYHVVSGNLDLGAAFLEKELKTLQGSMVSLSLQDGRFMVNDIPVVDNDIEAANGVIHVIDGVLLPAGIDLLDPFASSARDLIMLAIERGVPLFNNGQHEACAAAYEITAQALLGLSKGELSGECVTILRDALTAAAREDNAAARAWILRRALDDVYIAIPESETTIPETMETAMLIDDFSEKNGVSDLGTNWQLLTDRVMGGRSNASTRYERLNGKECLRMLGDVSLENNGGFVQIALPLRSDERAFDASDYNGIRLWVRGNGQPYYIHLRTTQNRLPWQYYSAPIATNLEWREVDIPFSKFDGQSTRADLEISRLKRIAVVGAKKKFEADIAVARLEFYR